jgi:hypothetical protein
VLPGSGTREAMLAILNDNPLADQAFTDLLSTDGDGSMGPFRLSGCSVTKLLGGVSQGNCDAFFDTSALGDFSDVFSFPVESSNSSGYDQVIGNVTLTIEGDVGQATPAPEPGTMTMLGCRLACYSSSSAAGGGWHEGRKAPWKLIAGYIVFWLRWRG